MIEFPEPKPILFIISGPAGSGKTTLCDRITATIPELQRVITSTTRAPRKGEHKDVDFHFMSPEDFQANIDKGNFLEHANVHGNLYGTQRKSVIDNLKGDTDLILNVDVQGAAQIREAAQSDPALKGRLCFIFVSPNSIEELRNRLINRGSDDPAVIERRLKNATDEIEFLPKYDYFIPSTSRDKDFNSLLSIYKAQKLRLSPKSA